MKECPACMRVYTDETLNFCLDDGESLVYGPAEPATAILSSQELSGEALTRPLVSSDPENRSSPITSQQTEVRSKSKRNSIIAVVFGVLLVAGLMTGIYWLYGRRSTAKQIDSIAVMPFVNESGNAEIEYLSDGMTDSLISSLSDVPSITVKARNSVFRYKGADFAAKKVGEDLSVNALVLGRVLQRGSDIALHIELVDAVSENVLWSSDYSRPMAKLVSLQSEIARDVANRLRARLTRDDENRVTKNYPANSEAYELYLKGRYFAGGKVTEEGLVKAIDQYKQAIDKDPTYALAYVGMARAYMNLGHVWGFRPPRETFPLAKAAITKALEIDNLLGEAHAALATYDLAYDYNWAEAEREVLRAIELNPNDAPAHTEYGTHLQALGRFDEAYDQRKTARDIEMLSPMVVANVGYPLYYAGRYDEAIQHYQKALDLDPNFAWSYLWIGQAYLEQGNNDEGLKYIKRSLDMSEGNIRMLATLGYAYAKIGNRTEAERIIGQLRERSKERYISPYFIATIYAGLNEKDTAFEWLEKAFEERHPYLILMGVEPVFRNLRSDPRFQDLKKRVGLP
ncbi:MAG TPA: tetratricopeptide repeat protein [Pyrinomonadaceae bacterium]|nr:tetratricopeptide repeat protein [Pyrinomonadaceae bacterium]